MYIYIKMLFLVMKTKVKMTFKMTFSRLCTFRGRSL